MRYRLQVQMGFLFQAKGPPVRVKGSDTTTGEHASTMSEYVDYAKLVLSPAL